jgi:hypothetical protein
MSTIASESIRRRVDQRIKECRDKLNSSPEHQKFLKLQQASLLCRLFQKQVIIDYQTSEGRVRIKALVSLTTSKVVILQDGTFIPIDSIINIDIV